MKNPELLALVPDHFKTNKMQNKQLRISFYNKICTSSI